MRGGSEGMKERKEMVKKEGGRKTDERGEGRGNKGEWKEENEEAEQG